MTTSLNISIGLAPIDVTGYTRYDNTVEGGITVEFTKDGNVANNTASDGSATSNTTTGYYQIALIPGSYNITAIKQEGETLVYLYESTLELKRGQEPKELDIDLSKESKTITGVTKDQSGNAVGSVTVEYMPDEDVENNTAHAATSTISDETTGAYSIELNIGSYNVTATKMDDVGMVVYESKSKLTVEEDDDGKIVTVSVDKKTVKLSGTVTYNGAGKENITLIFTKDETVNDNQAEYTYTMSSATGSYSAEVKPGEYNVTVVRDVFNISGVNYTYIISEDTNKIPSLETDIASGAPFNIKLEMKEADE